ncbi:hypothetical protein ALC60_13500 [Trachymyrmex zeteki]|uniref:CCHC-type domain-containing protein n=1 Tax=Mycetomoellerius zeteki TaxID=64791 RepID=A0A151WIB6_9HYME|nr:hypothetical protein ALC60_13500 [Trachymyrmex zeteki]
MEDSERTTEAITPQTIRWESDHTSETTVLQAVLRELQQLHKEQIRKQAELTAVLQRQDAEIRSLRESLHRASTTNTQISPLTLIGNANSRSASCRHAAGGDRSVFKRESCDVRTPLREEISFKLKPDTFDDDVPLREFFSQFSLIARANGWPEETKTAVLVSCLKGKARAILENVENLETLDFAELKTRVAFQRESIGTELLLEGVTSPKIAVERARAVKLIHENSFGQKGRYFNERKKERVDESKEKKERGNNSGNLFKTRNGVKIGNKRECWECGKESHFRSECPGRTETGNRE